MPGPGGGARGGGGGRGGFGGGSRGGSFGGGRPGGGFGGGFHSGGHRGGHFGPPPMSGGWHHRPRHYGGGGCMSSLFGTVLAVLIFGMIFLYFLGQEFGFSVQSGTGYDEERFQDYADARYAEEFGSSTAYEDNILLTVLVDEDHYSYYYIAWVGDHIETQVNWMLGSEGTELGQAMAQCINETSYKYSLDSNLAQVMDILAEDIQALGLESSFVCDEDHAQVESHLTNRSELDLTETTVNDALTAFTAETGIPVVIVVDDMADVFGVQTSGSTVSVGGILIAVLIAIAVVIAAVVIIRRAVKRDDQYEENPYSQFDDQY